MMYTFTCLFRSLTLYYQDLQMTSVSVKGRRDDRMPRNWSQYASVSMDEGSCAWWFESSVVLTVHADEAGLSNFESIRCPGYVPSEWVAFALILFRSNNTATGTTSSSSSISHSYQRRKRTGSARRTKLREGGPESIRSAMN